MTTENAARRIAVVGLLAGVLALLATPAAASAQTTERVSVDSTGNQAEGADYSVTYIPSISADGRFVAFTSAAINLVPGDTNGVADVFVHDRLTGTTERVSVDSAGNQGNGDSRCPAISADGRFVACASAATNLVPGDTYLWKEVVPYDCHPGNDVVLNDRSSGH